MKEPNFTEAEARELTRRYSMRTLGPIIDRIDELSGTDEHLSNLDVPPQFRKFVEPVVMATAWMERFPTDRPIVARGPRARGAGRPRARRSTPSSRAGPSDDSESSEPPRDGRPACACGCGLSMAGKRPQARYLNDAHRKRAQRARDRLDSDRPAERRLLQLIQERAPAPIRCKCEPRGQLVDENVCVPCGRPRGSMSAAWQNEAASIRSKQPSLRAPARRNPRYGDRKRKPVREYVNRQAVAA